MEKSFEIEKKYLQDTLLKFDSIINDTYLKIKSIPRMYQDNPVLLDSLLTHFENKERMLEKTKNKPYFARINFKEFEDNCEYECYIGKVGVLDENDNVITVDWRSPISSVYYDSNIGPSSYLSPSGVIKGELLVKRQYEIENKKLISFQDIDTVSNDEILKPFLGVNADNRLKNIVATIQSEQNKIIREDIDKNIIIQGVAGSGKTTVALHRIAYLVYNNRDIIDSKNYLVIGPNKFFVNYISSVLPDLDVNNVKQLTYDEILENLLNIKVQLIKPDVINTEEFLKYKLSMNFKQKIDMFLDAYEKEIIPKNDFMINNYKIVPNYIIRNIIKEVENSKVIKYNVLSQKIERVCLLINKYIKNNYSLIVNNISNEQMDNNYKKTIKELNNNCTESLKRYFSSYKFNIIKLYSIFLKTIDNYSLDIINSNIKNVNSKKFEFEDLPSLIYLYYKVYGSKDFGMIRHAVIDEAQNFGNFSFYALKCLMPRCYFSIFGDLAQSIYSYRGLSKWEDVTDEVFNNKCEIKYLLKSYRTTTQIMEEANKVIDYIGLKCALPVIRHGLKVSYTNNSEVENILNQYIKKNYKNVAIICKNDSDLYDLYKMLSCKAKINAISDQDEQYQGGICLLTSFLAKGLEFDATIIYNASNKNYNVNSINDMKLLYVAMTRALHELTILANNDLTKVLS